MKKTLYKLGRYSGLPYLFREFIQRNKVTFLLFHDLNPSAAERSFSFLKKKYNIISLDFYLAAVRGEKKLPKKALVLTFDDGYIGNYDLLPVVQKLKVPVTIFLCAAVVGTKRKFWFQFNKMPIAKIAELNKKSRTERLAILAKSGYSNDTEYDSASTLQRDQITEMSAHIDFQAHAKYHPVFPKCTDDEAWDEIAGSKEILENQYNLEIYAIAYPNGAYSDRDIALVKRAGYQCAITVDYGFNDLNTDLFRIKRFVIRDDHDINELIVKSSGVWAFVKTLIGYQTKRGYVSSNYPALPVEILS